MTIGISIFALIFIAVIVVNIYNSSKCDDEIRQLDNQLAEYRLALKQARRDKDEYRADDVKDMIDECNRRLWDSKSRKAACGKNIMRAVVIMGILMVIGVVFAFAMFQWGWSMVDDVSRGGSDTLNQLGTGGVVYNQSDDDSGWQVQNFLDQPSSLNQLGDGSNTDWNTNIDSQNQYDYAPDTSYPYAIWDLNHYNVYFDDGTVVQMSQDEYDNWVNGY